MAKRQFREQIRDVPGYPGYRVSNTGKVFSCLRASGRGGLGPTWRELKQRTDKRGARSVNLRWNGSTFFRRVHHLVLEAFVGRRPKDLVCCHYDGNPSNNRVDNLRWDTLSANAEDSVRQRLQRHLARLKKEGRGFFQDSFSGRTA